jgi:hypothetical protein
VGKSWGSAKLGGPQGGEGSELKKGTGRKRAVGRDAGKELRRGGGGAG